jgi:hypothetical protein
MASYFLLLAYCKLLIYITEFEYGTSYITAFYSKSFEERRSKIHICMSFRVLDANNV